MELSTTPDYYSPSIDEKGNYIDSKTKIVKNGIYCPCNSRKDKIYETEIKFNTHKKTKCHQNWLKELNNNKMNYYVELNKLKEIYENQKKIIQKLENSILNKNLTIEFLTEKIEQKKNEENLNISHINLLDI